ncbi:MAG: nicotinate (nicotinamide) nucleotide adenylyltransferase, partial [Chloroflexi bacterium]|nr:nicotinate (nicotinamide) nucleotide adenylyltransferase [Chloroflexota bacterium]
MALEAGDLAPSAPIRRLGVLGGTFDPIHIGHLIVAEEARARLGLDRVLFVPANLSPLKAGSTFFSGEERYHMVRLAIEGNPHFAVSRVDLDRTGPSYTVDTLRAIQAEYGPSVQLYFIIGMDALETFAAWHRPEEIIRLTRLVVVSRPGHGADWATLEAEVP